MGAGVVSVFVSVFVVVFSAFFFGVFFFTPRYLLPPSPKGSHLAFCRLPYFHRHDVDLTLVRMDVGPYADMMTFMTL